MKKLSFAKSLASVGLAAVCALGIVGCSEQTSDTPTYTGGVAATVNGVEIPEDKVTQAIQDIRAQMSLTEEDAWGQWLADNDYTPESVREEIVNSFVDQELVKQGGEAEGITADPTEIDQYVETMRGHYDSDSAWAEALEAVGMTEDEYRDNIALSLVSQQLQEKVGEGAAEPTDEEVLESAKTYVSSYDGAKKSSHILFEASDEAQAQEVLDKINAGELDFATAAESYSKDTASAAEGGNVGWDRLSNLVTEYTTALADLNKGDVSGLVTSTYGIHIIQCTDVFEAPEELTSLDQLPTEFQDSIRTMLQSSNQSNAYYTWLEEQRNAADIQINDMPEGLPYYVDMANYSKTETSTDGTGVTAVDADGNPITLDEGAEAPMAEGVDEGAEGAEDAAAAAADEAAADAEGAAPAGDDAAVEQPAEGAAE
ncbi:MAG: peptidylprolyl isomerase [Adlercreutzia equolifaciens]